ncbi:MAG: PhzF family phenazine biosynthesis protein [Planctomycetota bacterium]
MRLYQVDAFTARRFHGNPAAVVPLQVFPDDGVLQGIALENNLSETAFFAPAEESAADFRLRWFTPACEVDLCGHATLATAHVLWTELGFDRACVRFDSASGPLSVRRDASRYELDFPALPAREITDVPPAEGELVAAFGVQPARVLGSMDLLCVFENKRHVHELAPEAHRIRSLCGDRFRGVIATAPGAGHDFVSRFFAPGAGVDEDPVTGSAHCILTPYWAETLGKTELTAHQVSARGGELWCRYDEPAGRVFISGHAVTYLRGEIEIGEPIESVD